LPEIRRSGTVYLAEGYMDVISMHRAGVATAVAPCGTAFTDEQAKLLRGWADTAVLVFDSDEAGLKAADRGIVTCRRNGLACRLAVPGSGSDGSGLKDPADILQKFGTEVLKNAMGNTIMDFEYLIARGKTLHDTSTPHGKAAALSVLYPYLDVLGSLTERDGCLEAAADAFRVDRESAREDYRRHGSGGAGRTAGREKAAGEDAADRAGPIRMNDELFLLTLVSVNTGLYPSFRSSVGMREIEDPNAKELFVALEECFANGEEGTDALLARVSGRGLREFVVERGVSGEFSGDGCDPVRMMEDGTNRIRAKRLRRRVSRIAGELRLIERGDGADSGTDDDFEDLIAEKMRLDAEIRKLEGN